MKYLLYTKDLPNKDIYYNQNNLIKQLIENEKDNNSNKIVIVYPTSRLKTYKEKEFISKLWDDSNKPYSRQLFYNFNDFINEIKDLINLKDQKKILTEEEFYAIMKLVYDEVELTYFSKEGQKPKRKINNILSNIIYGFIKKGLTLEDISNKLEKSESKKNRLLDIKNIYESFLIKSKDYSNDNQNIIDIINHINSNNINFHNSSNTTYYFEYFKEFKSKEIELLNELFTRGLKIVINFKFLSKNNPEKNNTLGINNLFNMSNELDILNNEKNDYNYISNLLFNYSDNNINEKFTFNNTQIVKATAENKNEEVLFISKLVKKLILEDNYKPSDILILSRNLKKYSQELKNVFEKSKIPLNISDRPNLKSSPLVELINDYLRLFDSNFSNKYLFKIIKSPFLNYDKSKFNVNKFISIQNKYRNNYNNLNSKLDYFNKIINDKNRKEIEIHLNYLEHIFNLLDLNQAKKSYKKESLLNLIYNFCNKLKLDKYDLSDNINLTEYDLFQHTREKERLFSSLDTFIKAVENIFDINSNLNDTIEIDLNELIDELDYVKERTRFQIRELFDTSVTFTSIEQARGVERKVTIICGMIEGEFPLYYKTDEVLGIDLSSSENKHNMLEEELFFESLFFNEVLPEKIYFTNYSFTGSKENIESHFMHEIERIFNNIICLDSEKIINDYILKYNTWDISYDKSIENEINKSSINGYLDELTVLNKSKVLDNINEVFSASRLDELHKYPYTYLYNYIFQFKSIEEYSESPEANEIGSIFHKIMYELYSSISNHLKIEKKYKYYLQSNKESFPDFIPIDFNEISEELVSEMIKDSVNKVFAEHPENEFFIFHKENISKQVYNQYSFDKNQEILKNKITQYLYPSAFEFKFGYNNDYFIFNIEEEEIKFRGSIDRIDLSYENDKLYIGILDYKSSNKDIKIYSDLNGEEYSFQMFIYLNAIKYYLINNYTLKVGNNEIKLSDENIDISYAIYMNFKNNEIINYLSYGKSQVDFESASNIIKEEINKNITKLKQFNLQKGKLSNKYKNEYNLLIR